MELWVYKTIKIIPLSRSKLHNATQAGKELELLFHPVSVPIHQCLDPHNKPFARACASVDRDEEAQKLLEIRIT